MSRPLPRLAPKLPLPPYAYVPKGPHPHPTRDLGGHSYARAKPACAAPDPGHWEASQSYRYGIDLFNHGYYWEAHEVWEGLWHACGRHGITADFLKALIALAAAGVKQREGVTRGVQRHAERCQILLEEHSRHPGGAGTHYMGLEIKTLSAITQRLSAGKSITAEQLTPFPTTGFGE